MPLGERNHDWILYVDPDGEVRDRVNAEFAHRDITTETVGDIETAEAILADGRPLCVVSEYELPTETGLTLLDSVRETHGGVPFVLLTEHGSEQIASEAMSAGVTDYFRKRPLDEQIPALVGRVTDLVGTDGNGRVSETLKDRAMDKAPVGITVADMRLPDEPLIYVNEAFERLTGYSVEETVGRNCRFLQGEESDQEAIATMRKAIENEDSTAVELRNYTKDGTEFWNRVEIAPIRESGGEVTHYVGYQTDVSARKEAEIAARNRADALERKQQKLEALLARIEGLLRDVSVGIIHARTPSDIEQQVCDALVRADGYSLAWMSERVHDSNTDDIEVWAGDEEAEAEIDVDSALIETALDEGIVVFDGKRPDWPTVESSLPAVDNSSLEDLSVGSAGKWLGDSEHSDYAIVPVSYGETTYGVIGIRTDDDHEFDDHEAVVLSTLGRIVGTALNAVRTQSLLQGEAAIELELSVGDGESFVGVTSVVNCHLEHVGSIPPGEDPATKLFFEVTDGSPDDVVAAACERSDIEQATVVRVSDRGESGLVRLSVVNSPLIDALAEYSGRITDASAANGSGTVTVQLAKDAEPRTFVDEFESRVPGGSLISYRDEQRPQRTNQEFVADVNAMLTDRQRDALQTAYASGFFDWPRQTSGDEVAEVMDITRATFHQHLRTAERKLLDAFFQQ